MPVIDDQRFMLKTLMSQVTRISHVAAQCDVDPSRRNKAMLKVMAERLDDMLESFQDNVNKVANYNTKNNVEEDVEVVYIQKFEEAFYKCKAAVVMHLDEPSEEAALLHISSGGSHSGIPQVQLPKIKLPEFSGSITEWQNFSDIFNVTVHRNESLTPIQRHVYLRSALSGEALALVNSLPLTEANYPVCWDTLVRRYDNTHLLTNTHLDTLFSLPMTSPNPAHIRAFSGKIIEATGALKAIGYDVEGWAVPLLYVFCKRLHSRMRELWEERSLAAPAPSIKMFVAFLSEQARILEAAHPSHEVSVARKPSRSSGPSGKGVKSFAVSTPAATCPNCSGEHELAVCGSFRREPVPTRIQFVKSHSLCLACLSTNHFASRCSRKNPCKHCPGNHHSLLHLKRATQDQISGSPSANRQYHPSTLDPMEGPSSPVKTMQIVTDAPKGEVIVATAVAQVLDRHGSYQDVRLLIDPGSEASFISRSCLRRLGLSPSSTDVPVLGMGRTSLGICHEKVECKFKPAQTVELHVSALVVNFITRTPSSTLPPVDPQRLVGKRLADPGYFRPSPVDILLGAEWFAYIMVGEPQRGPPGSPSLIESIWGYCLIGRHAPATAKVRSLLVTNDDDLGTLLHRFWEIEEPPSTPILSKEDQDCERLYTDTVRRQPDGRYVVSLPFLPDAPRLGDSRSPALRRFLHLEKRLNGNATLKQEYSKFMADYIEQRHMSRVESPPMGNHYYIPHHCVFRVDRQGVIEKFRVVFDSSMKTLGDGPSLNQILLKGPKLQADIVDILTRARMYEVLLIADIRQMYRNILMCDDHRNMQRIFWRFNCEDPISEFRMNTVTYGVSSSPYLAIRTLHQLVQDEGAEFPLAVAALMEDTYMDDVVKSVPSLLDAVKLKEQLVNLMARGQFQLRKWRSNSADLLSDIPIEHQAKPDSDLGFESHTEPTAKILGLVWRSSNDSFGYQVSSTVTRVTKRIISSEIAKIYDPMGFICPVVFVGKCLLRSLWERGLGWDDAPPIDLCDRWRHLQEELPLLNEFSLPRCLNLDKATHVQLHGFADASESGYAGVVYSRCEFPSGKVTISLIMAKSKVAPVQSCSLPRLELCGILLVTRLLHRVKSILEPHKFIESTIVWSDSTVALHWVKSPPHRWKTFVANRVSLCQQNIPPQCYRHVPTSSNPADCASRGLLPSEVLSNRMWVSGPDWLLEPPGRWPLLPAITPTEEYLSESKSKVVLVTTTIPSQFTPQFIESYSSLTRLLRVTAWTRRFIHNYLIVPSRGGDRLSGGLTHKEITGALAACVRLTQLEAFSNDVARLRDNHPPTRQLRRLSPFLDEKGIIRVGGRLRHAKIAETRKHPIVLPRRHPFTVLVIDFYHRLYLHPGLSNLQAIIFRNFWIQAGRSAIYSQISKCMSCFRSQPRSIEPQMADLPLERVNPGKPFSITGVDYAGPLMITLGKLRKARIMKAYICLFVCFKTKAVHLELASELTTEAFLAALKRFIARRGSVRTLFSDCGTNFVGAKRRLEEWSALVRSAGYEDAVSRLTSERGIEWQMNPPSSPHFGGIWEANIKSAKRLLVRTIGDQVLTYEELLTVLVQVEATLNSRPLVPFSNDPNDLQALTPGHFLFMEPPVALEEPEVPLNVPLRDRWMLLRQMVQSFWHRWSADYLNTLQQRNKWTKPAPNLKEGMLVLIKEDNSPPLRWKMGRITRTFPGEDDQVRVAEVQTSNGFVRRPTVKLCPLPIN